ncbi:hypothetical protein [Micropruina sp.]|uniref:hypothetical protein n=1 Tax=Micropruina sp. TaxID=2737536 RepID=UPI0039E2E11A
MRRIGFIAALLLLSACTATTPDARPSNPATRFQTTEPLPSVSAPSGVPTALSEARLSAIRDDLSKRGKASDPLRVISAHSVTFSDGSLGCPQPGQQYPQAQVNGMRVLVEVAGTRYDYRFGRTDSPRLCENGPAATSSTR